MKKLPTRVIQSYWRATRGLTLGAQAAVIEQNERFLLVRHGYRPGWHFPGGGVERNESAHAAMIRELYEETGVLAEGLAPLFGFYDNGRAFRGDHIALYVVRTWSQPTVPAPNAEIAAQGFFAASNLPDGTTEATRRRIVEITTGALPAIAW